MTATGLDTARANASSKGADAPGKGMLSDDLFAALTDPNNPEGLRFVSPGDRGLARSVLDMARDDDGRITAQGLVDAIEARHAPSSSVEDILTTAQQEHEDGAKAHAGDADPGHEAS